MCQVDRRLAAAPDQLDGLVGADLPGIQGIRFAGLFAQRVQFLGDGVLVPRKQPLVVLGGLLDTGVPVVGDALEKRQDDALFGYLGFVYP